MREMHGLKSSWIKRTVAVIEVLAAK